MLVDQPTFCTTCVLPVSTNASFLAAVLIDQVCFGLAEDIGAVSSNGSKVRIAVVLAMSRISQNGLVTALRRCSAMIPSPERGRGGHE